MSLRSFLILSKELDISCKISSISAMFTSGDPECLACLSSSIASDILSSASSICSR